MLPPSDPTGRHYVVAYPTAAGRRHERVTVWQLPDFPADAVVWGPGPRALADEARGILDACLASAQFAAFKMGVVALRARGGK